MAHLKAELVRRVAADSARPDRTLLAISELASAAIGCSSSVCFRPRGSASMRIAQLAPLAESLPPKLYGGTERVVAW